MTFNPHIALTVAHGRAADVHAEAAAYRNATGILATGRRGQPAVRPQPAHKPALDPAPAEAQNR